MRQVPAANYGIIGAGRMAQHMLCYLDHLGLPYQQWCRKQDPLYQHFESFIERSDVILLLVNDDSIETFIEQNPKLRYQQVVHFSGLLHTPLAHSAHPLMTFNDCHYEPEVYQKIPFIIEAESLSFSELLPGLPNPHYTIPQEAKVYYHSLCVLSGNFTSLLWQKFFKELQERWNIPHKALFPFLEQTLRNLQNPSTALTGPLARGDQSTVNKHLDALKGDSFYAVYQAFCEAFHKTDEEAIL